MADDGFHEIQLNGKQLVFLFMAATVVAVVIFLCGVMVGRGVRVQQSVLAAATAGPTDPTAPAQVPARVPTTADGAPLSTQETLTYTERLEGSAPPPETLNDPTLPDPVSEPPAPAIPDPPARAPEAAAAAAKTGAKPVAAEPSGSGFVVQVAAVNDRGEADAIARRLSTKGYPAFVTTPAGVARVFRVRIGKYPNRKEAESIAARLEKEEQFKPWITR